MKDDRCGYLGKSSIDDGTTICNDEGEDADFTKTGFCETEDTGDKRAQCCEIQNVRSLPLFVALRIRILSPS